MDNNDAVMKKPGKREKLENPARLAELAPAATLARLGLLDGQTVCDIGAGSGIFSLAAAGITGGTVWAADTDGDILSELKSRAMAGGFYNLRTLPVAGCAYPIPSESADWALLVTTLHEIAEKDLLFCELRRILRRDGRVCLIEFHKAPTPMGPPPEHRLGAAEAEAYFTAAGFVKADEFSLGENMYCQTYAQKG